MRRTLAAGIGAGALLATGLAGPAAADDHDMAELSVLHGIPGLTVDVYVDGALTLDDFMPGQLEGPLELPDGEYEVALTASDAADASSPVLGPITLDLAGGMSYTAAAHLTADGTPTASLFENDTSPAEDGRLTVRHIAAAPAVDVWADGAVVYEDLANPDEISLDLPAATYEAAVSVANTTDPVLGPAPVDVETGVNTIVYAWGSAGDGSLALAAQSVNLDEPAPSGTAELSVLHGIPGLTVDVYVDGALTLDDFMPGQLEGPLGLPADATYEVALTASDAADASSPVLGPIELTLMEDMSYTAVAHLTEGGTPTASLFVDDTSPTLFGDGRLTVRHVAAAPAVDVWANGAVAFPNLANPDEVSADLPAATYEAAVSVAGDTSAVLGPVDLTLEHGVHTIVYAWGSAGDSTLDLATQSYEVGAEAVPLNDISNDESSPNYSPFFAEIQWLANQGITRGWETPDGFEFRPLSPVNRDAMAAFLYRYAGEPDVTLPAESPFIDVMPGMEHYKEIIWAYQEGITAGWTVPGGVEFRPVQPITRDAIAAFVYRFAGEPTWTAPEEPPFSDIMPGMDFYDEITWLESTGITHGWEDGTFRPLTNTARDAMAAFLFRFDQLD